LDAKLDAAGVELDAVGTAEDAEAADVSLGSTKPEVWAVAPAATGSTICSLVELLIVAVVTVDGNGMIDKSE
jgi:hypothetical protein